MKIDTFAYIGKSKIPFHLYMPDSQDIIGLNQDLMDCIHISFPYHKELVDEVRAMYDSKWNKENREWTVANCKRNYFAIRWLTKKDSQDIINYKKPLCDDLPLVCNTNNWWSHQLHMYRFIRTRKRCIIAGEPRTGKTRPTLQVFHDTENSPVCLFITTKSAYLGIHLEVQKWFSGISNTTKITVLDYYSEDFLSYKKEKVLCLFTYEGFQNIIHSLLPNFVVFDELHKLKNLDNNRTPFAIEFTERLEEQYKGSEYVIGLTGTPEPKEPTDWWSQCEVIRPGWIREATPKKFKSRYSNYSDDASIPVWERWLDWNKEELNKLRMRLAPLVSVYLQKDVMDLPPIRFEEIDLQPTRDMLRAAKVLTNTIINPLSLRDKLRQLSDGFSYINEYDEDQIKMIREGMEQFPSPKKEQLRKDLENYEATGRCIIYSAYTGSVDIITEVALSLGWSVLQIDGRGRYLFRSDGTVTSEQSDILMAMGEMDRSTNTGKIEKLLYNSQSSSGGTGVELSASCVIIYYSNSNDGAGRMQSVKRAYSNNMDKIKGLTIIDYFCLPTDRLIKENLDRKEELQKISIGDLVKSFTEALDLAEKELVTVNDSENIPSALNYLNNSRNDCKDDYLSF
jgi:hypothetical protein